MIPLQQTDSGVIFSIRVVPRASRSELAELQDTAVKLRIMAPPVDGKANEECIRTVAEFFEVKKRQVTIVSGHTSRTKIIAVAGKSVGEIAACLEKLPSGR
jgi:uncharacterized protein (TIGR00251 family)